MADDVAAFLRERLKDDAVDAAVIAITGHAAKSQRAFREVAAKRAILAAYEEATLHPFDLPEGVVEGRDDDERERDAAVLDALEGAICHLAAVYSDHPDYRQEWAP